MSGSSSFSSKSKHAQVGRGKEKSLTRAGWKHNILSASQSRDLEVLDIIDFLGEIFRDIESPDEFDIQVSSKCSVFLLNANCGLVYARVVPYT